MEARPRRGKPEGGLIGAAAAFTLAARIIGGLP